MKITPVRGLMFLGALSACLAAAQAQVIRFNATLSASQEVPATTSPASGSAIMLYDLASNTYDLVVNITGMANAATASHIHEAPVGQNGSPLGNLGGDSAYSRAGTALRGTFRGVAYTGDRVKLLQGGAYYNIHSAQFPGGEIRGQLILQPVRLVANLDTAQEQAAFPAVNLSGVNNFGGAIVIYNPADNTVSVRHSLFNFNNAFSNSHIHEGGPGESIGVRVNLGTSATAGAYNSLNGHISGAHDSVPFPTDPAQLIALLSGRMYLNYHSTTFTGGQLRGQIYVSNETPSTRFHNLAARGFVGAAGQELIAGIVVNGTEPVRTLITAKGPSLAAFGVTGALANPQLALFDSAGRQIALNEDVGAIAANSELSRIPGVPTNPLEAALVVVLPPGNYTAVVSGGGGTGVALVETYDLRAVSATALITSSDLVSPAKAASLAAATKPAVELCVAPVAVAMK